MKKKTNASSTVNTWVSTNTQTARVFKNGETGHWEVDYWLADELVETAVMKTENGDEVVFHNEVYADNSAENYVLGYFK